MVREAISETMGLLLSNLSKKVNHGNYKQATALSSNSFEGCELFAPDIERQVTPKLMNAAPVHSVSFSGIINFQKLIF